MLCAQITTLGQVACFTASHHHLAGAYGFDDVEPSEQADGGIDFPLSQPWSMAIIDSSVRSMVFPAEVFDDLQCVGAFIAADEHLDKNQFAHDRVMRCMLEAVDDVDELVHLQDDLAEPRRVAADPDGPSVRTLGFCLARRRGSRCCRLVWRRPAQSASRHPAGCLRRH